jgi:hypothetical protein
MGAIMPTESWVVAGPQIIEIELLRTLRVQIVAGRVDVVAHDDDSSGATVEVHSVLGAPLEVSLLDGELRVGYPYTLGGWENFLEKFRHFTNHDSVNVHIAVPREVHATLRTVTAEGLLAGVREDAQVSTVSGALVTDSTFGALAAHTVSGEIVVRNHSGDLRLNTVSGDLTAQGKFSRVSANSVSGALVLDIAAGTSSISATTVSGDVTVRLPDGTGITIDAKRVSGRVVVDGREYTAAKPGKVWVDLREDAGGCFVSTRTVSGDLTVLRGAGAH